MTDDTDTPRRVAADNATAVLRLEGVATSPQADTLLDAWADGTLTDEELTATTIALHKQ